MIYYYIAIALFIFTLYILFLYLLKIKIEKFEKKIINKFKEKNNQVASIFEVTKNYLIKHDDIFNEILNLKKIDFNENNFYTKIIEKSNTYKKIHNELNFIFRVCNKNPKINKDYKFLYMRELIVDISYELWENLVIYKKIVKIFNNLIKIKKLTIIWIFIPIRKIETI